jgi:hypothetical protein
VSEGGRPGADPTGEALKRAALADMRPAYRKLLIRLKGSDPSAFEEVSRQYREEVEPAIAAGDVDPILAWLGYGISLAERLAAGRTLAIDASGRARSFEASSALDAGVMILHVPEDDRAPATLLAVPSAPSESQQETAALLAG